MIKYFMAFAFFILFIITSLFFVILIFSSKRFSPIPYFPTNKQDLPLIIKALGVKKNKVIFDLGAGDGIVIFAAAKEALQKKLDTKFIAVEINPILILLLHLRRFFHPNKKNIKIIRGDMFKLNYSVILERSDRILKDPIGRHSCSSLQDDNETLNQNKFDSGQAIKQFSNITIYLYISPWFLDKVAKKILKEFPKAKIISYMYPIKSLKNKEKIIQGKNSIYIYS